MVRKISLLCILFSFNTLAQNNVDFFDNDIRSYNNDDFFKESESNTSDRLMNSDDWAETPPPILPINDYLPLLAVAAVGLGFYYRKELNQITK